MNISLPASTSLDVNALSRIFRHTTNSYKLIFFRSLLSTLETGKSPQLDAQKIVHHMLAHAWFPAIHFKLNLGSQDMILDILTTLNLTQVDIANSKGSPYLKLFTTIEKATTEKTNQQLLQYIPYRLLQPFFQSELKGKADAKKNALTADLSVQEFNSIKPLYKIEQTAPDSLIQLTLHQEWFDYLTSNLTIIKGWVELNWLQYLQTRNPNTPAISNKLSLPAQREALTTQRKFWDKFLKQEQLNCIFSKKELTIVNYELDHFIPWAYVAHNQYWNLLPILDVVNSSKSNHLPSKGEIIALYTQAQYRAVCFAKNNNHMKVIEDYILVLQCSEDELMIESTFIIRFTRMLETLIDSASLQGFQTNWSWNALHEKQLCKQPPR